MPRLRSRSASQRRKQNAECKRLQRLQRQETPEAAEKRRASARERQQKHRAKQSPEATAQQQALDKELRQQQRAKETPEVAEKRRASARERMQKLRAHQTPEAAEKRRVLNKQLKQQRRAKETPETAERQRALARERMQKLRAHQTPEAADQRRVLARERMQKLRARQTPEAADRRRAAAREGMRRHRAKQNPEAAVWSQWWRIDYWENSWPPWAMPATPDTASHPPVKQSSFAKKTTAPMLLESHPSSEQPVGSPDRPQVVLVKEEDLGDADTQLNPPRSDIPPVVGNVLDEEEASSLWRPECGSSAKDDDSTSSAVTELEEQEEKPADSVTAALEISSSSGSGPTPYSLNVIIKEEDGTPYQGYGDCAVMSQAIQVSRQQDHQDAKGERSDLPVTPQVGRKWSNCHHCGLSFTKKKALTKHLMHAHTPTRCKVCHQEFPNRNILAAHLRNVCAIKTPKRCKTKGRGMAKPSFVSCPTCSRSISVKHLSHHLLMHTGARPYSCQVCGKTYRFQGSLDTHERSHNQEKYQCSDCGKTFKEHSERDFHECVVFKGETEFSCSVCGESFGRLYLLKRHQLSEHPGMHFDPLERKTYAEFMCCRNPLKTRFRQQRFQGKFMHTNAHTSDKRTTNSENQTIQGAHERTDILVSNICEAADSRDDSK